MITVETLIGAMLLALFAGFCWGWRQCEQEQAHRESMQAMGEQIRAMAIRDGILDSEGRPIAEKPDA